jgi:hypothetical protein
LKKQFIYISLLFITFSSVAQDLSLKNEITLFSFKTKKGKIVSLSKDQDNKYLIYRFGTSKKIELEYPDKNLESWKKFKYNSYIRGGGIENAGMEIYDLQFENKGYQYILFETYHAVKNTYEIGLYVIHLKTNKEVRIEGKLETQKGSLSPFQYEDLLQKEDFGLFD